MSHLLVFKQTPTLLTRPWSILVLLSVHIICPLLSLKAFLILLVDGIFHLFKRPTLVTGAIFSLEIRLWNLNCATPPLLFLTTPPPTNSPTAYPPSSHRVLSYISTVSHWWIWSLIATGLDNPVKYSQVSALSSFLWDVNFLPFCLCYFPIQSSNQH